MVMPGAVFDVINQAYHMHDGDTNDMQSQYNVWGYTVKSNEILIVFDFKNSEFKPRDYNVNPFILGGLAQLGAGYYDWAAVTNGGIRSDGTGPQRCYYNSSTPLEYFIILPISTVQDMDILFRPANYNPSGWSEVVASGDSFWASIGNLSAPADDRVHIHNGFIQYAVNPYNQTNRIFDNNYHYAVMLDSNAKGIKIEVFAQGDWTIHLPEKTTVAYALNITWVNVPTSIYSQTNTSLVWQPFSGIISNRTDYTYRTDNFPVITGNRGWMHNNSNYTWDPRFGTFLTYNESERKMYATLSVPYGSGRFLSFKMANEAGWGMGEESRDQHAIIPISCGTTNITVEWQ